MKVYFLYGDNALIFDKIKELTNNEDLVKLDYETTEIDYLINEIGTTSLFGDYKNIVVSNSTFLKKADTDIEKVLEFISNNGTNNTVIFYINDALDKRLKTVKHITSNFTVIDCSINNMDLESLAREMFMKAKFTIDNKSLKLLCDLTGENVNILRNEIKNLMLLKINTRVITYEDVSSVVTDRYNNCEFKFIEAFVTHDRKNILIAYENMAKMLDEISIVSLLSIQIKLILLVLLNPSNNDKELSEMVKVHPFRIKLARKNSQVFSKEESIDLIQKLFKLDIDIKSGSNNPKILFQNFITTY